MEKVKKLLNKYNVELVFVELDCEGFALPDARAIMVNINLDEEKVLELVLHELKHLISHKEYIELYKRSSVYRSKMELEANEFAIDTMIDMNNGEYNYSSLIENFNIGIGYEYLYRKSLN